MKDSGLVLDSSFSAENLVLELDTQCYSDRASSEVLKPYSIFVPESRMNSKILLNFDKMTITDF